MSDGYAYFPQHLPTGEVKPARINFNSREVDENLAENALIEYLDRFTEDDFLDEDGERVDNVWELNLPSFTIRWTKRGAEDVTVDFTVTVDNIAPYSSSEMKPTLVIYGFGTSDKGSGFGSQTLMYVKDLLGKFGWNTEIMVPEEERDPSATGFWDRMAERKIIV